MTDHYGYERVVPLLGGKTHLREPDSYISLCGRTPTWRLAPENSRTCTLCTAKLLKALDAAKRPQDA